MGYPPGQAGYAGVGAKAHRMNPVLLVPIHTSCAKVFEGGSSSTAFAQKGTEKAKIIWGGA
jgi:hypothetical protein